MWVYVQEPLHMFQGQNSRNLLTFFYKPQLMKQAIILNFNDFFGGNMMQIRVKQQILLTAYYSLFALYFLAPSLADLLFKFFNDFFHVLIPQEKNSVYHGNKSSYSSSNDFQQVES